MTVTTSGRDEQAMYRFGGWSGILLGGGYVVIVVLFALAGAPPDDAAARLAYLAPQQGLWWAITYLSVVTDVLFLPIALALFVAYRDIARLAMTVGAGLLALFVILDLAVTWPAHAALIEMSASYAVAPDDAARAALVAAASYPSALLGSSLFAVYAILVPALGILVMSVVMARTGSGRAAAAVGVLTGALGAITVIGSLVIVNLAPLAILTSVLTTVWVVAVGYGLLRGMFVPPAR